MIKTKTIVSVLFGILLLLQSSDALLAAPSFQSGPNQVRLLELYTSEGCSSCPPAEKWLSRLNNSQSLGSEFVPVAFHVTYWDRLGWKDILGDPRFTKRQHNYAGHWQARTVYTPGFVLDGREWQGWQRKSKPPKSDKRVGLLRVNPVGRGQYQISWKPNENLKGPWVVEAALMGSGIESKILRGENAGLTMTHDYSALDLTSGIMYQEVGQWRAEISFDHISDRINTSLAVWVYPQADPTQITQATMGSA